MDKSTEIIKNFQNKSIKHLLWLVGVSVLYCVFLLVILAQISKQVGQLPIWLIVGCEILAWASTTYLYLRFDRWLTGLRNANFNEAMAEIDQAYKTSESEKLSFMIPDKFRPTVAHFDEKHTFINNKMPSSDSSQH